MPLPINSQVYMPNPLIGIQAERYGFEQGRESSAFANIVNGVFKGAATVGDMMAQQTQMEVMQQQADFQYGPEAEELRERKQADDEKRTQIAEAQQRTAARSQEWQEKYQSRYLDLYGQRTAASNARRSATESIKAQKEKEQIAYDTVMGGFFEGDLSGFMGVMDGGDTPQEQHRNRSRFTTKLMEDEELGQAALGKAEELLATNTISPQERKALEDMVKTMGWSSKFQTQGELAKKEAATLAGLIKAVPEIGPEYDAVSRSDGKRDFIDVFQIKDGKRTRIGVFNAGPGTEDKVTDLYNSVNALNAQARIVRESLESVAKSARAAGQRPGSSGSWDDASLQNGGQTNPTEERPAKMNERTPTAKLGLRSAAPANEQQIIDETQRMRGPSPAAQKARETLQNRGKEGDRQRELKRRGLDSRAWVQEYVR